MIVRYLDTLGHSRTGIENENFVLLKGNGSDLLDTKSQKGRAKRKHVTKELVKQMILIATEKKEDQFLPSLWNIYRCQSKVHVSNGRIYGKYCGSHVCSVCNANRKAEMIEKYYPIIDEWTDTYHVVLTSKSVSYKHLKKHIDETFETFKKIKDLHRKQFQRGKVTFPLMGIKTVECEFNPQKRWYNPHIHLIVSCEEAAIFLKREWVKRWPEKHAQPWAQHIGKINSTEKGIIEVLKYGTKVFSEFDKKEKGKHIPKQVYPRAHYNIYKAFRNRRLFDRFGFNLPPEFKPDIEPTLTNDFEEYEYDTKINNWISIETQEPIFSYIPDANIEHMLYDCMNSELE